MAGSNTKVKYPFYQYYSWWTIALVILYAFGVLGFNPYPSILVCLIGTVMYFIIKYYKAYNDYKNNNKKKFFNINLALFIITLHIAPLFFIPSNFITKDLLLNIIVFLVYLISLNLQNTNMVIAYHKLLEKDDNITFYSFYKDQGLIP